MGLLEAIKPQSPGQEKLAEVLKNKDYRIVGIFGPTGSGKSLFSLAYSIDAVRAGEFKRLIVVKPMIDVTTGKELSLAEAGPQFLELAKQYVLDVLGEWVS
ncbi:MAG: PhoH family protein, partial [Desulfurococcales archaeon]|nr:PhoH family protein [Desulfurococcales archaeon]